MANPMKGEAALGDLTLCYNFGTFCALEEKTGKKMPELMQAMQEGIGFSELRDFLWAGLLKHHPQTEEEVVSLLDDITFEVAALAVGKGVMSFFNDKKEKGNRPTKKAQ